MHMTTTQADGYLKATYSNIQDYNSNPLGNAHLSKDFRQGNMDTVFIRATILGMLTSTSGMNLGLFFKDPVSYITIDARGTASVTNSVIALTLSSVERDKLKVTQSDDGSVVIDFTNKRGERLLMGFKPLNLTVMAAVDYKSTKIIPDDKANFQMQAKQVTDNNWTMYVEWNYAPNRFWGSDEDTEKLEEARKFAFGDERPDLKILDLRVISSVRELVHRTSLDELVDRPGLVRERAMLIESKGPIIEAGSGSRYPGYVSIAELKERL